MATVDSLCKSLERLRVDAEQRHMQHSTVYGGYKQLLAIRLERRLAGASEEDSADFLAHFKAKVEMLS